MIVPVRRVIPPSSVSVTVRSAITGATFDTEGATISITMPVSSSVTVTLIVGMSLGVPVGSSST